MPWVGLSWGRWTLVAPGRDYASEYSRTHTRTRFTQVRGPREEVKPLLLLLVLIYVVTNRVTEKLLELYASNWKMKQVFFSPPDRPSRRRAWGTLYSGAPGYSVKQSYCGHTPWSPPDIGAADRKSVV